MSKDSFYITTPIYYVNDKPHMGHAYTTVACDVLARFHRLDGRKCYFLTGTDEHGQKVAQAAEKKGVDPQSFTDEVSQNFRDLIPLLNFSNDDFIRTTEDRHKKAAQALWQKLEEAGAIYLDSYSGWYAVRDEAYYGEDELTDGPDGTKIAPSGAPCEWVEEESYFFRLSEWGPKLLEFYDANPDFVQPQARFNEVKSFVKSGLRDLSISRTRMDWGVPVPGAEGHVMYVWIDALTNYMSALGYPDTDSDLFKTFWPAEVHMVGKDILRFHAVYWPAFLMAAGIETPKKIFAHGWWTIEGQKMSKSLGNVIAPHDLVERYGVDQTRYALMREVPFGNDGNFSHAEVIKRLNADLANGLGNLAQRTLSMIYKNCDAKIPEPTKIDTLKDNALYQNITDLDKALASLRKDMDDCAFHRVLETINSLMRNCDAFIDEQAPWALKKTDLEMMATVLYVLADAIRAVSILLQPFMPDSTARILDQLGVPADHRTFDHLTTPLAAGTSIDQPQGVFPRLELEEAA